MCVSSGQYNEDRVHYFHCCECWKDTLAMWYKCLCTSLRWIQIRLIGSLIFLQSPWVFLLLVSIRVVYVLEEIRVSSESFGIICLAAPRRSHLKQFLCPTKISSISPCPWSCWQWGGTVPVGRGVPGAGGGPQQCRDLKLGLTVLQLCLPVQHGFWRPKAGRASPMFVTM